MEITIKVDQGGTSLVGDNGKVGRINNPIPGAIGKSATHFGAWVAIEPRVVIGLGYFSTFEEAQTATIAAIQKGWTTAQWLNSMGLP